MQSRHVTADTKAWAGTKQAVLCNALWCACIYFIMYLLNRNCNSIFHCIQILPSLVGSWVTCSSATLLIPEGRILNGTFQYSSMNVPLMGLCMDGGLDPPHMDTSHYPQPNSVLWEQSGDKGTHCSVVGTLNLAFHHVFPPQGLLMCKQSVWLRWPTFFFQFLKLFLDEPRASLLIAWAI